MRNLLSMPLCCLLVAIVVQLAPSQAWAQAQGRVDLLELQEAMFEADAARLVALADRHGLEAASRGAFDDLIELEQILKPHSFRPATRSVLRLVGGVNMLNDRHAQLMCQDSETFPVDELIDRLACRAALLCAGLPAEDAVPEEADGFISPETYLAAHAADLVTDYLEAVVIDSCVQDDDARLRWAIQRCIRIADLCIESGDSEVQRAGLDAIVGVSVLTMGLLQSPDISLKRKRALVAWWESRPRFDTAAAWRNALPCLITSTRAQSTWIAALSQESLRTGEPNLFATPPRLFALISGADHVSAACDRLVHGFHADVMVQFEAGLRGLPQRLDYLARPSRFEAVAWAKEPPAGVSVAEWGACVDLAHRAFAKELAFETALWWGEAIRLLTLRRSFPLVLQIEEFRELEGRYPSELSELPIAQVPFDPFGSDGSRLRYRVHDRASHGGHGYDLYSVGPDGLDSGVHALTDNKWFYAWDEDEDLRVN